MTPAPMIGSFFGTASMSSAPTLSQTILLSTGMPGQMAGRTGGDDDLLGDDDLFTDLYLPAASALGPTKEPWPLSR